MHGCVAVCVFGVCRSLCVCVCVCVCVYDKGLGEAQAMCVNGDFEVDRNYSLCRIIMKGLKRDAHMWPTPPYEHIE